MHARIPSCQSIASGSPSAPGADPEDPPENAPANTERETASPSLCRDAGRDRSSAFSSSLPP